QASSMIFGPIGAVKGRDGEGGRRLGARSRSASPGTRARSVRGAPPSFVGPAGRFYSLMWRRRPCRSRPWPPARGVGPWRVVGPDEPTGSCRVFAPRAEGFGNAVRSHPGRGGTRARERGDPGGAVPGRDRGLATPSGGHLARGRLLARHRTVGR